MTTHADEVTCQELVEIVTEYFDGALPDGTRELFEVHLQECEGCRRYLNQIRTTIRLTGTLTAPALDPGSQEQLLQLFRDWNHV